MRLKQRAVIELLVAEKESVMKFHKQLKYISVNNITDALQYSELYGFWVPRSLIDYHKTVKKDLGSESLSRCESGDDTCHTIPEGE